MLATTFRCHCRKAMKLVLIAVALVVASCSDETRREIFGAARLVPTAQVDATLHLVGGEDATGKLLPQIPLPEELALTITNSDGSYSHRWDHLADYPANEPLLTGTYKVEVSYGSELLEGPNAPYYYGAQMASLLTDGSTENVCVTARLANTMWRLTATESFKEYFSDAVATLHSACGGYVGVDPMHSTPVFLRSGGVSVYLDLELPTGECVEFVAAKVAVAQPGHLYDITLDMQMVDDGSTPQVIVSFDESTDTDDTIITLSRDFLQATAPALEPVGYIHAQTLVITEGTSLTDPIGVRIVPSITSRLVLTSNAPALVASGWPAEIDLMQATKEQLSQMIQLGLKIEDSADGSRYYDFTDVLYHLRASGGTSVNNAFTFMAASASGRVAGPLTLSIVVKPVDINIVGVSPIVIGVNQAQMRILSRDADLPRNISVEIRPSADKPWQPAQLTSVEPDASNNGLWYVKFGVPQATTPTVDVRILYCSDVKAQYSLRRVAPEYNVAVDGFAKFAYVKIQADDEEISSLIISLANVYIDGVATAQVSRHPDLGYILVGGLEPNRSYKLTTTLYNPEAAALNPGSFTPAVSFATEHNAGVPNGTFDEILAGQIKYENLPAGGRYSQNIVDIFNRQNYVSYNLAVPKGWANTNSKTFCTGASRHNSWYMVPSVYTISDVAAAESPYAVVIRSTGWDLHGADIPDYRQTGQPYTDYSLSIPSIAHRAAGKLFLGSYTFDPSTETESYREGVDFHSRPSALNGFYSFIPSINDLSDRGLAIVEVIGKDADAEVVIARGEYLFTPATSYTAFSIPLIYRDFGRKATKIKILFASSNRIGSIAEESASVATYSDPTISMSVGNELRLDNLTFSY